MLSEFAGAVEELPEALPCNPFDLEGLAGRSASPSSSTRSDRRRGSQAMAATIRAHDVYAWLDLELGGVR